ncbi:MULTISPECIES: site-specific integrase [Alphaproteobacteria]|jgi:integrase|uniref:Site-specific integrase n=4 Tax=Pseudomonadota TaxID=1224 RepID=A0A5P6P7D7_9BRAD|nr:MULTISPECIES: site-specific integrase [Alphaproteobacteria]MCP4733651.1 site-specific integrase [Bosea sp. (in: a-proteobacteria)]MBN8809279.1 site-specific integrase [Sphingomonas sp.]MBR1037080.1 site-specific integrase [Bradyrhizobium viridifuturi]MBR1074645.1 site-specific integrase [Bradyrhizobium viridifuturi]MBR1141165.1 site-specific integrase [Bradyrhizobium denitrificans]
MGSLTDGAIRRSIKDVELTGKQKSLADGEGRGVGRLVLVVRPMPKRVLAEWMAQQWRDGKRIKAKLGDYPSMSLAAAREVFKRDFADAIQKGRSIKIVTDARPGTVADLFEAYVASLKEAGKPSWKETEKGLNKVADTLGRNRLAREIEPDEVTEVLRPIFERGAPAMADHVRCYIRAAYSWGMKSEHDYRNTSPRRFRLVYNPAAGIPTEPKVVGSRWLDEDEFVQLWRWLECPDVPVHPPYLRAVQILMLTGQRVEEIARLHKDQWDSRERILDWSKTKNSKPHAVPVPSLAAELLDSIKPNEHGWFFPSAKDPSKPVSHGTLYAFMWRQRDRGVIPVVTNRDLRRTWKTLSGKAGVPKEIRDRIQNHALQDVSSKSYDRWNYMPEKRAGMARWDKFARTMLAKKPVRRPAKQAA